jgi:hypothetical protein
MPLPGLAGLSIPLMPSLVVSEDEAAIQNDARIKMPERAQSQRVYGNWRISEVAMYAQLKGIPLAAQHGPDPSLLARLGFVGWLEHQPS